jgi:hypothetical protein
VVHAWRTQGDGAFSSISFLLLWHGILLVCAVLNTALLMREAASRGQAMCSAGMKMALKALAPPLLIGGLLGIGFVLWLDHLTLAALAWVLGYGQALLAMASFSPRSLVRLGWAFVLAGLGLFVLWASQGEVRDLRSDLGPASLIMALTFGLLHLIYAAALLLRRSRQP